MSEYYHVLERNEEIMHYINLDMKMYLYGNPKDIQKSYEM